MASAALVFSVLSVALAGVQTYMSWKSGEDQEKRAKKLGKMNAALSGLETAEEMRRMNEEERKRESTMRAKMAAVGVSGDSFDVFADYQKQRFQKELAWTQKVGQQRQAIAIEGGNAQAAAAGASKYQGMGGMFSAVEGTYNTGVDQGWWGGGSSGGLSNIGGSGGSVGGSAGWALS
jgi:hypothetical protein